MLGKADTPANEGKQEGVQAETEGDKTLGKRKDPQEGGRTIQQRETRRGTMGDKTVRKADTPSPQGTNQGHNGKHPRAGVQQRETRTGYNGRQRETRPSARRTHLPTRGVKKGYNGRHRETRPSERQTHHPTKGNKKGYNGQWETKGNKKEGVQWETI